MILPSCPSVPCSGRNGPVPLAFQFPEPPALFQFSLRFSGGSGAAEPVSQAQVPKPLVLWDLPCKAFWRLVA